MAIEPLNPNKPHVVDVAGEADSAHALERSVSHLVDAIDKAARVMSTCSDRLETTLTQTGGKAASNPDAFLAPEEDSKHRLAFSLMPTVSYGAKQAIDLGPLESLVSDPTVSDILVNGPSAVFVERQGKIEKTNVTFPDHASLVHLADRIVRAVGRKLDPKRPVVDARLLDGSRVNIVAPPLAIDGLTLSIRKFARDRMTLDWMTRSGCMSEQLSGFLVSCAKAKVNIIVSGGTGAGKTTLMNAISQFIQPEERIVTIEDSAELQLQLPHIVRLETKEPENRQDRHDEVTIRDLVKNALRMRPDRIIVGEVRGPEAFDMIQAMNTGHDGSITTIHANTPRDGLARIENMVSMANLNVPVVSVRKQIASAIQIMIQIMRMEDGKRRIALVSEIVGMEGDTITMQDLFRFQVQGKDADGNIKGAYQWTGVFPRHARLAQILKNANILNMK